jgi:hypothetical protein
MKQKTLNICENIRIFIVMLRYFGETCHFYNEGGIRGLASGMLLGD